MTVPVLLEHAVHVRKASVNLHDPLNANKPEKRNSTSRQVEVDRRRSIVVGDAHVHLLQEVKSWWCFDVQPPTSWLGPFNDRVMFFITLFSLFSLPLAAFFPNSGLREIFFVPTYLVDFFFLVCIVVQCHVGVYYDDIILTKKEDIFMFLLQQRTLGFNLFSCIPIEIGAMIAGYRPHDTIVQLLRFNRVLRTPMVFPQGSDHEKQLHLVRFFVELVGSLFLVSHWFACGFFGLASLNSFDDGNEWTSDIGVMGLTHENERFVTQYVNSLYWSVITMMTVGYGDILPITNTEKMFAVCVVVIGAIFYAVFLGNVAVLIDHLEARRRRYRNHMDYTNEFIRIHRLPGKMKVRLLDYTQEVWNSSKGYDVEQMLSTLPLSIRNDLQLYLHANLIAKAPIFHDCPEEFISSVVSKLTSEIYLQGDYVCRFGEHTRDMYFLRKGECEVLILPDHLKEEATKQKTWNPNSTEPDQRDYGHVVASLSPGAFFGEIALLFGEARTASVRAKIHSVVCVLTKKDFDDVLNQFKEHGAIILAAAARRRLRDTVRKQEAHSKKSSLTATSLIPASRTPSLLGHLSVNGSVETSQEKARKDGKEDGDQSSGKNKEEKREKLGLEAVEDLEENETEFMSTIKESADQSKGDNDKVEEADSMGPMLFEFLASEHQADTNKDSENHDQHLRPSQRSRMSIYQQVAHEHGSPGTSGGIRRASGLPAHTVSHPIPCLSRQNSHNFEVAETPETSFLSIASTGSHGGVSAAASPDKQHSKDKQQAHREQEHDTSPTGKEKQLENTSTEKQTASKKGGSMSGLSAQAMPGKNTMNKPAVEHRNLSHNMVSVIGNSKPIPAFRQDSTESSDAHKEKDTAMNPTPLALVRDLYEIYNSKKPEEQAKLLQSGAHGEERMDGEENQKAGGPALQACVGPLCDTCTCHACQNFKYLMDLQVLQFQMLSARLLKALPSGGKTGAPMSPPGQDGGGGGGGPHRVPSRLPTLLRGLNETDLIDHGMLPATAEASFSALMKRVTNSGQQPNQGFERRRRNSAPKATFSSRLLHAHRVDEDDIAIDFRSSRMLKSTANRNLMSKVNSTDVPNVEEPPGSQIQKNTANANKKEKLYKKVVQLLS